MTPETALEAGRATVRPEELVVVVAGDAETVPGLWKI